MPDASDTPKGNLTYDGWHHYTSDVEGRLYQVDSQLAAQDAPDSNVTTATATQLRITDQVGSLRGLVDLGEHTVQSCTSFPYGDGAASIHEKLTP